MRGPGFTRAGGPAVLGLVELPLPEPGPGKIRVRVRVDIVLRVDIVV